MILIEEKAELMRKLGKKQLTLQLHDRLDEIPAALARYQMKLAADGSELIYTYDSQSEHADITALLADLDATGTGFKDLSTKQSSLEEIFVDLVKERE
jgi:ABC-2 type transport system ATP-binding protein